MTATLDGADSSFSASVNKLLSDTGATLQSGVRNTEQQQALYNLAVKEHGAANASHWAAEPGHSNHESGFAADIGNWQNITDAQLAQYGLHRPMPWEPWHVEPIGYKAGAKAYTTPPAERVAPTAALTATKSPFQGVGMQTSGVDQQVSGVGAQVSGLSAPLDTTLTVSTQPDIPTVGTVAALTSDAMDMDRFMSAISGQESGGNYTAKNKDSGAFGRYQIMPSNWSAWAKAAGLDPNAAQTPQNQDKVARNQFQQYFDKFGNWHDVAVAWYAGPNAVGKTNGNANQGAYPSINTYATNIVNRMNS